jgi:P4 family phage/plasmid primase-like protien
MATLQKLMNKCKVEKGSEFTHTTLGKYPASYYISTEMEDEFMPLYVKAIEDGADLHITEKHRDISPVLIDLDFKQDTSDRLYIPAQIEAFLNVLKNHLRQYVDVADKDFVFYVMEKGIEARPNKSGGYKDGIHIVIPNVVTKPEVQYMVRENILKGGEMEKIFGQLFSNKFEDIYDEAVIEKNNWFLYMSKKPDEEYAWVVTKVYDASINEIDNIYTDEELTNLLSIRNKFDASKIHADKLEEIKQYKDSKAKPTETNDKAEVSHHIPSDLDTIHQLVMMLNPNRADTYKPWLKVGMCLKNIDERLCGSWIEFSKQSNKFNDGECENLWRGFTPKNDGLTEGSLRYWAKMDNPTAYNDLQKKDVDMLIYSSRNETHADIAKVVHALYKDQYVCCYVNDRPAWFEFKNHHWEECPNAVSLKQKISNEVSKMYNSNAAVYHLKAANTDSATEQAVYTEVGKKLATIATKTKMAPFKSNIINECTELFAVSRKDFADKLDERKHLIGFTNGVYDLDAKEFRDGRPDDNLSMCVGYDYTTDADELISHEILQLLQSIFPSSNMIRYMLRTIAYALHGNKHMEFCQFWIGTGANGKGVLSKLLQVAFGEYCYCPDVSVFTTRKASSSSANPELAKMKGKRIAIATEPNEDDKFQVGALKAWTGGDKIQARALYKDNVEFESQFLIIIQMNHKPALSDFDSGIARRLRNVEFPHKFVSTPQLPHERKGDTTIKKRFETDIRYAQQFMRMLLEVYNEDISGHRPFETPTEVDAFTKEYLDANNKIGAFLVENCEVTNKETDMIRTQTLFDEFRNSDHYNGKDIKNFVEHMGHNGFKSVRQTKRKLPLYDKQVFVGIKVKQNNYMIDDEYEC